MTPSALIRVIPFIVFMGFIGVEQAVRYGIGKGFVPIPEAYLLYLYPFKAVTVCFLLFYYRKRYTELCFGDLAKPLPTLVSIITGIIVFVLWINMDWTLGSSGAPAGYDPFKLQDATTRTTLIAFRIFGASLVVPVMEELFWRSFILRYLVNTDFEAVPVGVFTWGSFLAVAVLFGLEHDFLYAGIMAGVAYNLLAVYTRSIAQCVLSHGVTNLVLAVYVLTTGNWKFW